MRSKSKLQIAIDGPVAAGKGTVAYLLAKKIGILYVDTGATYRATAYAALAERISLEDEEKIVALLKKTKIELKIPCLNSKFKCLVFVNGKDVTKEIRTPEISKASSKVAVLPKVRKYLVLFQKKLAENQGVVMEGRDITTRVLEKADLKIFLTADPRARAERRRVQLEEQGIVKSFEEVLKDTLARDTQDSTRKADPLKITKDSIMIDTTTLSINQVVKKILEKLILHD